MAVYEGTDSKGRRKRSFELVRNLKAAEHFKTSSDKTACPDLVPLSDAADYPLKCILKTGTMVLFYEKSPEELYECTKEELVKRLYKVLGFSILLAGSNSYGRFTCRHHQEARPAGELKAMNGT